MREEPLKKSRLRGTAETHRVQQLELHDLWKRARKISCGHDRRISGDIKSILRRNLSISRRGSGCSIIERARKHK